MQSALISKIEKAKRYAQERERASFTSFNLTFRGEHGSHTLSYRLGEWHCTCSFFSTWGQCSHRMAVEKMLGEMLPRSSSLVTAGPAATQ